MSIAAAENAGPGPCELQDPLWVKMSAITGGITKKRKKSDAKPQSQINKCLNEKRRRTQENLYIDELAELISATDMSSGKTDKCQILQRTVEQIRHIRQQESSNNSNAVQQGEVSSSNPSILSHEQLNLAVFDAVDCFMLALSPEGRVVYVSDSITKYTSYTKDDVLGKDIYNFIHHGDHNTFMPSLLPMSSLGWTSEPHPEHGKRRFNCRFLVDPPEDREVTMEEKQQRVAKYETMNIKTVPLPKKNEPIESGDISSESATSCVICVVSKLSSNELVAPVEQFTIKLDPTGKITQVDISWLSPKYAKYINKELIGTTIKDLCHPQDLNTLMKHLSETLQVGENTSEQYRLHVSPDKFLKIQTKSKVFKSNMNTHDGDFIMATSSIITDNDLMSIEGGQLSNNKVCSGHSSNRCVNNSSNNNGNNNNNVGGPLMSVAHLNGQVSGISARGMVATAATSSNSIAFSTGGASGSGGGGGGGGGGGNSDSCNPLTLNTSAGNSFGNLFSGNMDLELEFTYPSSTWDLDGSAGWTDRPESRASGPPNSRPPSQPSPTSPSPQGTFSSSTLMPIDRLSPNPVCIAPTFSNSFPFSPLQETTQTATLSSAASSNVSTNGGSGVGVSGISSGVAGVGGNNTKTIVKRTEESNKSGCPTSNSGGGGSTTDNATTRTSNTAVTAVETQNNSVVSTESVRLRNLLTKGASEDSQDNTNNDSDNQNKHRILKILLNQQDEDDYHSEHKVRTSPSNMPKPSMEHSKSSLGNNMLLQLLNEKNDDEDEETRAAGKKRNELLQQLMKDDEEKKLQEQQHNRENDPLLRSLGFNTTSPSPSQSSDHTSLGNATQVGQKRPGEDGDLNVAVKRPVDGSQVSSSGTSSSNATSKLWEKNKMLASLLAKQPPQSTNIPPIPPDVISATPHENNKMLRSTKQQQQQHQQQQQQQQQQQSQQQQPQQQPWTGGNMQVGSNNAITTTATSARPLQSQSRQLPRQATNTYLSHMLSQQQRPQMGLESEFAGSGEYRQARNDPTNWDNQSSDPDLSEILDQVIEFVPDEAIANVIEVPENNAMNETMAINAIQKTLMSLENDVNSTSSSITMSSTPPAYSTAMGTTPVTTSSHNYQPPPMYQQTRMRFNAQPGIRQTGQFAQLQQLQQQRSKLIHQQQQQQQQQQKQRLLQQQQQQQLLIPSNATATDQISSGIHNIDNLLNNTVAPPNVSLQRSSVPDSQVSPGYGASVQMASGHRLTHSYSHPSTIQQHHIVNNNFNSGQQVSAAARLSPHSPAGMLSFSHPPLSPRVAQGNYGNTPRLFNVNQVRPQQQVTAQQQLQQQQQRSMPSPGTAASARQSPFPAEAFPPPTSPTASQFPPGVPNTGAPNPSAQYRLQRTTSTPSATTQLPGGIGSPRHYGGVSKEQPLLSPSHSHSACPATPTHNQHNATNTQHFTSQQHTPMLYQHTNANTINTAEMQNNQFCYDRSSVPLYSSGGEAQDARSLPSGNPVNHQIGGNASTSEFVRQEVRAIVGARMQQQQQQQQRVPNNLQNNLSGQVSQDDLEALGLTFEMPSAGEAVVSDGPAKIWGSAGSAPSSSRITMEEARGDPTKSSLLQKLLQSE